MAKSYKLQLSRPVIAIVGPTASGKSGLAIAYASAYGGEVVSADSMQVYKGMDIGTAKVPPSERIVPHHGLDLIDPGEPFSAALFQEYSRNVFQEVDSRGSRSVLCGGTGFYVRAALDDYDFVEGEQVGNPVRDRYNAILAEEGFMKVWNTLDEVDPESAAVIAPRDSKRVIRALEMHEAGESYARQLAALKGINQAVPAEFFGIDVDREVLYGRIEDRVDRMREEGLIQEVGRLMENGFADAVTSRHAIGYKEVADALLGGRTMDQAFLDIKQATRRYAKRQMTWFRRDGRIRWIDGTGADAAGMLESLEDILSKERI